MAPVNQRWTTLARSQIARQYHSTAVLTTNGTILVSGCDRCAKVTTILPYSVSPTNKAEYRQEIFYPPFWWVLIPSLLVRLEHSIYYLEMNGCQPFMLRFDRYDNVGKPSIINLYPQIVGYGEEFTIKYTGVVDPNVQVHISEMKANKFCVIPWGGGYGVVADYVLPHLPHFRSLMSSWLPQVQSRTISTLTNG